MDKNVFALRSPITSFIALVILCLVFATVQKEFEYPDEFHQVTSTLTPERFSVDGAKPLGNTNWIYWSTIGSLLDHLGVDKNFVDPLVIVRGGIFTNESGLYYQLYNNQSIIIILRCLQILIAALLVVILLKLLTKGDEFRQALSFVTLYLAWPAATQSIVGYNAQIVADLMVPISFWLYLQKRYVLMIALLAATLVVERQAIFSLPVFVTLAIVALRGDICGTLRLLMRRFSNHKRGSTLVGIMAAFLLIYLLSNYNLTIIQLVKDLVLDLHAQVMYLKNDFLRTWGIFLLTSAIASPSLTALTYIPLYLGHLVLIILGIREFLKTYDTNSDSYLYVKISVAWALIWISIFNGLSHFRYHTYLIPTLLIFCLQVLKRYNLRADMLLHGLMLVSAISSIRFLENSYVN